MTLDTTPTPDTTPIEADVVSTEPATLDEIVQERQEKRERLAKLEETKADAKPGAVEEADGEANADELEADQTADDTDGQDEDPETESEADGDEQQDAAIDAPEFWSSDGKQHFSTLDPVTQQFLMEQDKVARTAVSQKMAEAADKVKLGIADTQKQYQAKQSQLDEVIASATAFYEGEYGGITQEVLSQAVESGTITGEQAYGVMQDKLKAEQQLQQYQIAKQDAQTAHFEAFVKEEGEKLKTLVPDLVDEAKGKERMERVATYLKDVGLDDKDLKNISASELSVAYDAMRWREAQTKLKAKPLVPKPAKVIKPSGKQSGKTQNTKIAKLMANFNKTGDMESLLEARKLERATA